MGMRRLILALLIAVFLAPAVSAVIAACGSVAASDVLAGNISGVGTCLTITGNDVEIDCLGFTITYKTGGTTSAFGVMAVNKTNVTVKNCNIIAGSGAGFFGHAFQLLNVSNVTLANNSILTNGTHTNFGMNLTNSTNVTFINSTVVTTSTAIGSSFGLQIGRSAIINISNNRIFTSFDDSNFGITMSTVNHSLIANNIIRTGNLSSNFGIEITNSLNTTIASNDIVTMGDNSNFGILARTTTLLEFGNMTITGNNITTATNDSSNFAIDIVGLNGVVIQNNTIRTNGSDDNYGIITTNFIALRARNITIWGNSVVTDGNDCCNFGVNIDDTENATVAWNIISTNGSDCCNDGVLISGISRNITVANNSISVNGTDPFSVNIGVDSPGGTNVTIWGNNITTNGTSINEGIFTDEDNATIVNNRIMTDGTDDFNIGIEATSSSFTTIVNNTVFTNGSFGNYGILVQVDSVNNIVENNTIFTDGTSNGNIGLYVFDAYNGIFTGNVITTNGTSFNDGIIVESGSNNNTFSRNTISTFGTGSYGINITTSNNVSFNHTLLIDPVQWIFSNATGFANYSNTTFFMPNGSVQYNGTFALAGTNNITHNILNISFNSSFVNSTAEPELNTTAQITLNDLPFADPTAAVDFEDDGTFASCSSPQCEEVSFAGSDFIFNVSSFTSYAATEGSAPENISFILTKNDSQDPVNVSSTLNYTITLEVNGTAFNISLTDIYPAGVSFVSASPAPDVGNDTWIIGNLTNSSFEINITITIGSSFANGTVINNTANISFQNSSGGITTANVTENTTVEVPPAPPPPPPSGGGGGSNSASGPSVCPIYCSDPKYAHVAICQNYPCKFLVQPTPEQTSPAVQRQQNILPTPTPMINLPPAVEAPVRYEEPAITQTQAAREPATSYNLMYTLFIVFALAAIAGFAAFAHMHHKKR